MVWWKCPKKYGPQGWKVGETYAADNYKKPVIEKDKMEAAMNEGWAQKQDTKTFAPYEGCKFNKVAICQIGKACRP